MSIECRCGWRVRLEDRYCSACKARLSHLAPPPRYLVLVFGEEDSASVDLLLQNVSTHEVAALVPVAVALTVPDARTSKVRFTADGVPMSDTTVLEVLPEGSITLTASADAMEFADEGGTAGIRLRSNDPDLPDHETTLFISKEPPQPAWFSVEREPITDDTIARFEVEVTGSDPALVQAQRQHVQLRNVGAAALVVRDIEVGGSHDRWLQLSIPQEPPIRRNEVRTCEVLVQPRYMPLGFQGAVPITIRFAGLAEPVVVHANVVTLLPPSLVIDLPAFTQEAPGMFALNNCPPYGQQDFEVRLSNGGTKSVEISLVRLDGQHAQLYQGGWNAVRPGDFKLMVHPGIPDNSLSLNVDMERLRHGVTHVIELRFEYAGTPPKQGGLLLATARVEFRPRRRPLNFAVNTRSYVGIDFGTSNSCVGVNELIQTNVPEDQFQLLPLSDRGQLAAASKDDPLMLPSVIFFRDVGHPIIGRTAKNMAAFERKLFRSFKRTIGITVDQYVDGVTLSPEDLAEIIFGCLIDTAIQRLPDFPARIVATCPANFYHFQRIATLRACRRAMLRKLLLAHADELREMDRLTHMLATQTHGGEFQRYLEATPEARQLIEDARRRFAEIRPDITWDTRSTSDCLLLLLFLATSRRMLMDFSTTATATGPRVHGSRFSEELTRAMFSQLWRPDVLGPPPSVSSGPGGARRTPDGREAVDVFEDCAADALQKLLGTDVLILDEPSAAAYAYVLHEIDRIEELPENETEFVAVYDLGGGTFDISIMAIRQEGNRSRIEVIHTDGVNELGGDDLDYAIACLMMDKMELKNREDLDLLNTSILELDLALTSVNASPDRGAAIRSFKGTLKRKAEEEKIAFSENPTLQQMVERLKPPDAISVKTEEITVTRDDLMAKVRGKIAQSIDKTVEVLDRARRKVEENGEQFNLKYLILAGKASRLPLVREMILGDPRLNLTPEQLYPGFGKMEKACVARGAGYFGYLMADRSSGRVQGGQHPLSHSVGTVESTGLSDRFNPIPGLEKGTPMTNGVVRGVYRRPWVPNGLVPLAQNAGTLKKVLGNRDIVSVGTFIWTIPVRSQPPGVEVEVVVTVDQNGLVAVSGLYGSEAVGRFYPTPVGLAQVKPFVFA